MTWEEVQAKIVFWSPGEWQTNSQYQPAAVADTSAILDMLEAWN